METRIWRLTYLRRDLPLEGIASWANLERSRLFVHWRERSPPPSGQAETYALVSLVKEVIWSRHLLRELGFGQVSPTVLRTDNAGVFKQSTKAINHTTAKHYRISQAYIRQQVLEKELVVAQEESEKNETDALTKALHAPSFVRHRLALMGPQWPPNE